MSVTLGTMDDAFAGVRKPLLEGAMPPAACYTDPAFLARETERIFRRDWIFVGDTGRLAKPGDWWSFDLAGIPLILARGRDGALRGFANTCRHRGCKLLNEGTGNSRAFKCAYHGWVYGMDGRLTGAPQMEHSKGFDKADYGLHPVRVENWGVFLFVCLDPATPPLATCLGDYFRLMAEYELDRLMVTRRAVVELGCNWKVYAENLMEAYHIPYVHAASISGNDYDPGMETLAGKGGGQFGHTEGAPLWLDHGSNHAAIVSRHTGSNALLPTDKGFPPMPRLTGTAAEGSYFTYPFPNALIAGNVDCLWYVQINPRGPDRCVLTLGSCFHEETVARPDFAALAESYYRRLDVTTAEDVIITEEQQKGLSSPLARPGRLSHMEPIVHAFRQWVLARVGA
ncbi:MAG: aromatic ring-hydroxylating oxygenase subunit alpha [Alphaproteobacteria bacterium]